MTTLFTDDFNRSDGAAGGNWTGDTFLVSSNQARFSGSEFGARYAINTTSLGTANYEVSAELTQAGLTAGGPVGMGLVARYQDANNFYLFWDDAGATNFVLYVVSGGGYSSVDSYGVGSPYSDPVTLKLSCNGTAIEGYINGVLRVSTTDSTHTTEGDFGFRMFNPGDSALSGARYDNVLVADFITGTTLTPSPVAVPLIAVDLDFAGPPAPSAPLAVGQRLGGIRVL